MAEPARDPLAYHDEIVNTINAAVSAAQSTAASQQAQAEAFLTGGLDSDIPFGPADAPNT